jgi:uncharacterized C2H2 Zn-finger protein
MTTYECNNCGTLFSTTSNLKYHMNNAQYCLSLRAKMRKTKLTYQCDSCEKCFSNKRNLNNHLLKCVDYVIDQKDKDIEVI